MIIPYFRIFPLVTAFGENTMNDFQFLIKKSPEDKRDFIAEDIMGAPGDLPAILDYSPNMPPVRNQGSQGSCAAMAAAALKEWEERKDVAYTGYMSPQFIYNIRPNAPGDGMYTRDLMKILNKSGVPFEEDFPYGTMSLPSDAVRAKALNYVVKSYALVETVEGLKAALVANGPCLIALPVYNYGLRMWNQEAGQNYIGHAMAIIGYSDAGFIIRNSWGAGWGIFGYTLFPYSDWGMHWETWTTLDAKSVGAINPESSGTRDWLKKRFNR
jgi:hypothetical protein